MWKKNFDRIYLVNLPSRPDRLEQAKIELDRFNISFTLVPAIKLDRGAEGLYMTMQALFEHAEKENFGNILVLEDDVQFSMELTSEKMNNILAELPKDYHLLYLGGNAYRSFQKVPECKNILKVEYLLSTHAVAYSREGRKLILEEMRKPLGKKMSSFEPLDMMYVRAIQSLGKSYISNPLLAFQRPGYSDIEKRETDYTSLIQGRFKEQLSKL